MTSTGMAIEKAAKLGAIIKIHDDKIVAHAPHGYHWSYDESKALEVPRDTSEYVTWETLRFRLRNGVEVDADADYESAEIMKSSVSIGATMICAREIMDSPHPRFSEQFDIDYDLVADEEGHRVSILLGLMHFCRAAGVDFDEDLDRAQAMFSDDLTYIESPQPTESQ